MRRLDAALVLDQARSITKRRQAAALQGGAQFKVPKPDANLEYLLRDLPDQNGARLFLDRLAIEQPRAHQNLLKQPALLADVLALAAWSPLLATTLEQNPEYLSWLLRAVCMYQSPENSEKPSLSHRS